MIAPALARSLTALSTLLKAGMFCILIVLKVFGAGGFPLILGPTVLTLYPTYCDMENLKPLVVSPEVYILFRVV